MLFLTSFGNGAFRRYSVVFGVWTSLRSSGEKNRRFWAYNYPEYPAANAGFYLTSGEEPFRITTLLPQVSPG